MGFFTEDHVWTLNVLWDKISKFLCYRQCCGSALLWCGGPDPTFQFNADPDPTTRFSPDLDPPMLQNDPLRLPPFRFNADADPDPAFHLMWIRIQLPKMIRIRNTVYQVSFLHFFFFGSWDFIWIFGLWMRFPSIVLLISARFEPVPDK